MLLVGAELAIGVAAWLAMPGPTLAGLFSGALTNAPALAAAQEALGRNRGLPVIAFGIAYPFGVLGVMLSVQICRSVFGIKPARPEPGEPIEVHDCVVQNPDVTVQNLAEVLRMRKDLGFVISRVQQGERTGLATAESRRALGDIVAVVGHRTAHQRARHIFGEPSEIHIEHDRAALD